MFICSTKRPHSADVESTIQSYDFVSHTCTVNNPKDYNAFPIRIPHCTDPFSPCCPGAILNRLLLEPLQDAPHNHTMQGAIGERTWLQTAHRRDLGQERVRKYLLEALRRILVGVGCLANQLLLLPVDGHFHHHSLLLRLVVLDAEQGGGHLARMQAVRVLAARSAGTRHTQTQRNPYSLSEKMKQDPFDGIPGHGWPSPPYRKCSFRQEREFLGV